MSIENLAEAKKILFSNDLITDTVLNKLLKLSDNADIEYEDQWGGILEAATLANMYVNADKDSEQS
jgi:hypothetical protein